jgi:hypothetical protein
MTTIHQQISFVKDLRESYDNHQREAVTSTRTPEAIAELLRDIEENLHAMRLVQLNGKVVLCDNCNQAVLNNIGFAKMDGQTIKILLCARCAEIKNEL